MSLVRFASGLVAAVLLSGSALAQVPQPQPAIDLKLMDKTEADRARGCTVALWQSNKDPVTDRYATLFIEQLTGNNNARQPARIKVGNDVLQMRRVAVGGKTSGYGLFEFQLYKLPADDDFVILELKLGPIEGEAVDIEGGTMSVVMKGRQVFRANVKGGAGCMTAPISAAAAQPATPTRPPQTQAAPPTQTQAPPPAPAAGSQPIMLPASKQASAPTFRRYQVRPQELSRAFLEIVRKQHDCDPAHVRRVGVTGFQLSEESAIWQIPCAAFAYQTTSVFALVYLPSPADNLTFAAFDIPRGPKRTAAPSTLIDPTWDVAKRIVTSIGLGRAEGDCGVLERYRVLDDGTFELIEYREKANCDGKAVKPEQFPLRYQRRT
jgi:hypothetical protein